MNFSTEFQRKGGGQQGRLLKLSAELNVPRSEFIQVSRLRVFRKVVQPSRTRFRRPEKLDEKVASLHLPALHAEPTVFTQDQADYKGVKV